jgi:hypothetical protein
MDAEGGGGECGGEKEREEVGKEVAHEGSVFGKRGWWEGETWRSGGVGGRVVMGWGGGVEWEGWG